MMTTDTARRLPIKTIFSGPAGGVSQACFVGAAAGIRDFITYDMGGTSTDVCLVRDLHAADDRPTAWWARSRSRCRRSTCTPSARAAARSPGSTWTAACQVGPRSAGAVAGPGRLRPRRHRAHRHRRQRGAGPHRHAAGGWAAASRIDPGAGARGGGRAGRAAWSGRSASRRWPRASSRIAVARMTSAIREISIQRGHDPRDFTLIAFGGAGPMHAARHGRGDRHPARARPAPSRATSRRSACSPPTSSTTTSARAWARCASARRRCAALFAEMEAAARRQLELRGLRARAAAAAPLARPALPRPGLRAEHRGRARAREPPALDADRGRLPPPAPRASTATRTRRRPSSWSTRGSPPTASCPSRPRSATGAPARSLDGRARSSGGRSGSTARAHDCPVWERERLPERARARRARHRGGVRRDHRGAAGLARRGRRARQPRASSGRPRDA